MSERIGEILDVIEKVRDKLEITPGNTSIHDMRIAAVKSVAMKRGIEIQTVLDKFIRQLQPDVKLAGTFDKLLEDWLLRDSDELKKTLLQYSQDNKDIELINGVFDKSPESDISLAQEFGLEPNDEIFKEGKQRLWIHLTKERNPRLVKLAKKIWVEQNNGEIHCSVCSFSFQEAYGKIGEEFIEAHHKKTISSLTEDTIVELSDLIPVCSNCHSMLHRHRPWLSIEELKEIVSKQAIIYSREKNNSPQ